MRDGIAPRLVPWGPWSEDLHPPGLGESIADITCRAILPEDRRTPENTTIQLQAMRHALRHQRSRTCGQVGTPPPCVPAGERTTPSSEQTLAGIADIRLRRMAVQSPREHPGYAPRPLMARLSKTAAAQRVYSASDQGPTSGALITTADFSGATPISDLPGNELYKRIQII